jgi:hypothetical protein
MLTKEEETESLAGDLIDQEEERVAEEENPGFAKTVVRGRSVSFDGPSKV